jgi:hypothetical protein
MNTRLFIDGLNERAKAVFSFSSSFDLLSGPSTPGFPALFGGSAAGFMVYRAAALSSTLSGGFHIGSLASARARLLASARHRVNGGPGAALGFLGTNAPLLVTFLDMLGLTLLLARIAGFAASWHEFHLPGGFDVRLN